MTSQDQLQLFQAVKTASDGGEIIETIRSHSKQSLSWFQDIIPGLVPGDESNEPWLAEARDLLWLADDYTQHERLRERKTSLQAPEPLPLHVDLFNLRSYWPLCIRYLSPMTPDMAKAVNTVSQVLYRSDIHEYKQGGVSDVAIFDRIWFIITRQSVQDKFISPIVRELNKLIIAAEDDLGKMQVDDILPSEDAATDFQQVQLQNDYHTSLLQALVVLRKTIIEEKDVWDKSQDSAVRKHDRGQDVIGEAKRSKR